MLSYLKKILSKKPKITPSETYNEELVSKLCKMTEDPSLEVLFFSPTSKLLLLNTYTNNFQDLLFTLLNTKLNRSLIAINIYSYFNTSRNQSLKDHLTKIIPLIESNKLSPFIEHDLFELTVVYDQLKCMEQNNG